MLNFSPAAWNYGAADIGGRRLIGKAMGAEDEKADRASCRPKSKGGGGGGTRLARQVCKTELVATDCGPEGGRCGGRAKVKGEPESR